MKSLSNVLIFVIVILLLSCTRQQSDSERQTDDNSINPLTHIKSYLDDESERLAGDRHQNDLPIAQITDITVGVNGVTYILDNATFQLVTISSDGTTTYHQLAQGDGPMEFKSPRRISTDPDGNIYISDDALLKVVGFDSEIQFINTYPVKYRVSDFVVDDSNIFSLSFGIFRQGAAGIIDQYRLAEPNSVAYPIGNSTLLDQDRMRAMSGNTDRVFLMDDYLILMRWYPYQITWYTPTGDSLRTYSRDIDWFEEPARTSTGMVDFNSGLRSVGTWCPNKCYTVVRYYRIQEGERTYYWDLYSDFQTEPVTFEESYFIQDQPTHIVFNGADILATYIEPEAHVKVYGMEF